jgi:hypothetical protein
MKTSHFACAVMLFALTACRAFPSAEPKSSLPPELEQLKRATRPFQSLDSAVAAGYPAVVKDCLVHEHHGAMGFHHVNRKYVDAKVEVERPEILLYERLPNGAYRLNGVEYIVPYSAWPADSVAPVLMGQTLKRDEALKIWFLHVWVWSDNADGIFADYNPAVQCDAASRKIFRLTPPAG